MPIGRNNTVITVISKIAERPAAKDACLVVIYGHELGRKYNLDRPSLVIGRSSRADVVIDQDSISRTHSRIVNTGKELVLKDAGSTNGTYVNDQLVDEHVLRDGDLVKIGGVIFKFLSSGNIENQYHEEIYRLTTIDGLTQVYNKRYFLEALEREVSRAHRYARDLSLLLFDLDHFKQVNDTYGHLVGDAVLKGVAGLVARNLRREDVLARYGGEEFVVVLPEQDAKKAGRTAEKIRGLIEGHSFNFDDVSVVATISIGIAALSGGMNGDDLLRLADEHLYKAKKGGRNRVVDGS